MHSYADSIYLGTMQGKWTSFHGAPLYILVHDNDMSALHFVALILCICCALVIVEIMTYRDLS